MILNLNKDAHYLKQLFCIIFISGLRKAVKDLFKYVIMQNHIKLQESLVRITENYLNHNLKSLNRSIINFINLFVINQQKSLLRKPPMITQDLQDLVKESSIEIEDQLINNEEEKQMTTAVQEKETEKVKPAPKVAKKNGSKGNSIADRKKAGEWLYVSIQGHSNSKCAIGKLGDVENPHLLPLNLTAMKFENRLGAYGDAGFDFEDGHPDWVGKSVIRSRNAKEELITTNDKGKVKYQLALAITDIWDCIKDGDVIHYIAAVHLPTYEQPLFDAVNGTHTVKHNGERKTFTIKPYKIAMEGAGVIAYHKATTKGANFTRPYLVDIGGGTAIGSPMNGYKLVEGVNPQVMPGYGFRDLINELCSDPQMMMLFDEDASLNYFEVEEAIRLGNPTKGYVMRNKDITAFVNTRAEAFAKRILIALTNSHDRHIRAADIKLATGGSFKLKAIADVFQTAGFQIVKDPVMADCIGLYKLCQSQIAKNGGVIE